jgi:hypothetical protein
MHKPSPPDALLDALADVCTALLKDEQNETPPEATNLAGGATDGANENSFLEPSTHESLHH